MSSLKLCFVFLAFAFIFEINAKWVDQESSKGDIWAVLVAGSGGFDNYRHQADVCHAYQVLRKRGIPESHIVVMMYDDIANSPENPRKGVIINEPDGYNVYPGVPHDYVGEEVTPQNFLKVLLGDSDLASKGKKVLKSGPNDNVFVYFADHGSTGFVAFPDGELYASQLNKTIQKMYEQKKYSKLVLYIEACESGSMFDGILPDNINVFVTTAADPKESSYACCYDDQLQTFLSDCYSINWIDDTEKTSRKDETLQDQFEFVRWETNTSQVTVYGDLSMGNLPISQFQGEKTTGLSPNYPKKCKFIDAVSSRDVPLELARRRYLASKTSEERAKNRELYEQMQLLRSILKNTMYKLARVLAPFAAVDSESLLSKKNRIENISCHESMVKTFKKHCINISRHQHVLNYMHMFVNVCNAISEKAIENLARESMISFCQKEVDFVGYERIL